MKNELAGRMPIRHSRVNTTNLSNSLHCQTPLKDTIFSVRKSRVKILLIGLSNTSVDIYFLTSQCIEWATQQILCPRCKELFNFMCNLVSRSNKLRDAATELDSKETFLNT